MRGNPSLLQSYTIADDAVDRALSWMARRTGADPAGGLPAMIAARTLARFGRAAAYARALCRGFGDTHPAAEPTAVALAALYESRALAAAQLHAGARRLLALDAPTPDPAAATNVLYTLLLAAEAGLVDPRLEACAESNLAHVRDALDEPGPLASRDLLLWLVAELCARFARARAALGLALRTAVRAQLRQAGTAGDPLALAMRLGAASSLQLGTPALEAAVTACQLPSGAFPGPDDETLATAIATTSLARGVGR